MRVLVTGSRTWTDAQAISDAFDALEGSDHELIVGDAKGADAIARYEAGKRGWTVRVFVAAWGIHGRAAGPIRNQQMVDARPDLALAFIRGASRGTRDCVRCCEDAGIPVIIAEETS
jgi:hypothetical protein